MKETAQKGESWEAVGVTSFGEAVVLLDSHDQPVMNTLLYTDERGAEQCRKLVHEIGLTYLQKVTGLNPHEQYSISKLMWIRENCPEKYHQAKKIFLYAGYIVYMLTSEHVTDYSLASRTMAFDIHRCQWDKKILEAAGIEEEKLPRPLPTGTIAGVMREELKQELGITGKAAVTGGCPDQVAAAAGVGALKSGDAVNGSGTVECITPVFAGEKDGSCRSLDDCGAGSAPDGVCHAADCPLCPDAEMDEGKIPLLGGWYHFWRQFDSFPLLSADSASGGKDAAGLPKICGGSDSLL